MTTANSIANFQLLDWSSVPTERVAEGIDRQMVWSDRLMVCRLRFAPGTVTAIHTHPHDQITLVMQGRVRFFVEGKPQDVSAGQVLVFPSNLEHGATMLDDEVVLIDIFTPIREDFLAGQSYTTR
jgi:quercetin dioxygenase-like cupin family protein